MSGFFGDLAGDIISNAEDIGFSDPDDGLYEFEVLSGELKVGTKKDPDAKGFIVHFNLNNDQVEDKKYGEYFGVPQPSDPRNPSEREKQQASFLKARLLSLGIGPEKLNSFEGDDIEGVTGTLRIVTNKGGYKAVRDLKLKAGAVREAASPVQPVARPTTRKAPARKPVAQPVEAEVEPEETAEAAPAAPAKARPTAVSGNPFAS